MRDREKWVSGLIVLVTLPLTVPVVVSGFLVRMLTFHFMAGWEVADQVNRRMVAIWSSQK